MKIWLPQIFVFQNLLAFKKHFPRQQSKLRGLGSGNEVRWSQLNRDNFEWLAFLFNWVKIVSFFKDLTPIHLTWKTNLNILKNTLLLKQHTLFSNANACAKWTPRIGDMVFNRIPETNTPTNIQIIKLPIVIQKEWLEKLFRTLYSGRWKG